MVSLDVSRVVVEDQLDGGVGRIGGIDFLEEADELPRTMPVLDTGVNLAAEQIDPGEQAQRAMAFIFVLESMQDRGGAHAAADRA